MSKYSNYPPTFLFVPGHTWVWELCAAAAPQQGVGMARGRDWQRFAHGMAPVVKLVLAASAEASPERTHTCYPSCLPLHAEGTCEWDFDLKPHALVFLPVAVCQRWQLEVLMVLNSPILFQFAPDHINPSYKTDVASCSFQPWPTYAVSVDMGASLLSAHAACHCII